MIYRTYVRLHFDHGITIEAPDVIRWKNEGVQGLEFTDNLNIGDKLICRELGKIQKIELIKKPSSEMIEKLTAEAKQWKMYFFTMSVLVGLLMVVNIILHLLVKL